MHRICRPHCVRILGLMLAIWLSGTSYAANCPWALWDSFKSHMISEDGRVIDRLTDNHYTTSEGQAYALFFALINHDRALFDRLLIWTENNLSAGDLGKRLPAWQWGKNADGQWAVTDSNPASDADVWIAYSLAEAARIWNHDRYAVLALRLANLIIQEETVIVPKLGRVLLPGPSGFVDHEAQTWRINPSYITLQLFRHLHRFTGDNRWNELAATGKTVLKKTSPIGIAPDWRLYQAQKGFVGDKQTGEKGSYGAIRVYLWLGTMSVEDPSYKQLAVHFLPMLNLVKREGFVPVNVDTASGKSHGRANAGFMAALLPFASRHGIPEVLDQLKWHMSQEPLSGEPEAYYQQVLGIFGTGAFESRYRFNKTGGLDFPKGACG